MTDGCERVLLHSLTKEELDKLAEISSEGYSCAKKGDHICRDCIAYEASRELWIRHSSYASCKMAARLLLRKYDDRIKSLIEGKRDFNS